MSFINGYLLLSYGPRPVAGAVERHPAARQQLHNLRHFRSKVSEQAGREVELRFGYDSARKVEGLARLPMLQTMLEDAVNSDTRVVIDDIRRIFARCVFEKRSDLFADLDRYGSFLYEMRTGKLLADATEVGKALLLYAEPPIKYQFAPTPRRPRSANDLRAQTAAANEASARSRAQVADELSAQLAEIRDRIMRDAGKVTLRQVTDAANAQGMTTSRGGLWTISSVQRALKRQQGS